jgi:hypothetical protein
MPRRRSVTFLMKIAGLFDKRLAQRLPGYLAAALTTLFTMVWTGWGTGEMYHEGWWGAWYNRLPYLIPGAACLTLTLVALTWPGLGGWLLIAVGGAFTVFYMDFKIVGGRLTFERELGGFLVSAPPVIIGALFLVESFYRRRRQGPPAQWWRRNLRYLLATGFPLLVFVVFSAHMLPIVLTRVDDGGRGARLIEGNGLALTWAPEGPGWNWRQPWGGYPSWNSVALYGVPPVGLGDKPGYGWREGKYATGEDMAATNLCRYLSEDGLTLMDEPQDIWHMPTSDEVVRSLARHGQNAGCAWDGERKGQAVCDILPDKESPLWATDRPVIYYWTAGEYDARRGYFVAYNGFVNAATKTGGNPRHSYRCVREP